MTTGDRIKKARRAAGLSQSELGRMLGVTQVMISAYEKGIRRPKIETLAKIADALGVLTSDLLTYDILADTNSGDIENWIDNFEETKADKINDLFDSLNDTGQNKAIEQVEMLTKIPEYRKDNGTAACELNAAHERTDIEVTDDMRKHDDAIMDDENF